LAIESSSLVSDTRSQKAVLDRAAKQPESAEFQTAPGEFIAELVTLYSSRFWKQREETEHDITDTSATAGSANFAKKNRRKRGFGAADSRSSPMASSRRG